MDGSLVTAKDLVFDYPTKRALFDINLEIPRHGITALVGPNGAGKTTLIRCLVGLAEPFSGAVAFKGNVVADDPRAAHRAMGYLPDFYELYDDLSVRACLEHGAEMRGIPRAEARLRAERSAERLGIADRLDHKVSSLSRGLTQRAAIARAIIHEPEFLVLDEPAAGLDPDARLNLSALFRQLRDDGMTLLVSSHILAELEDYCTHMVVIRAGRVVDLVDARPDRDRRRLVIVTAEPTEKLTEVLQRHDGIDEFVVSGSEARLTLSGGDASQWALLRELVEAGVPVIRFRDLEDRLQDTYRRAVAGSEAAS